MNILITIAVLVVIWGFVGYIAEDENNFLDEIPNPKKKKIYIALCGPFLWVKMFVLWLGDWFTKE